MPAIAGGARWASLLACAAAVVVRGDNGEPGWRVGWGFEAHGGFPANPWHSWAINRSTAVYFIGNATGMDSPSELAAEVKLGYVGIGWQLNNVPSHYSHLETFEIEEAKNLKALRPDVRVSVLRNTEVATVFWDSAKAKMFDPDTQDFWTQCDGKPCKGSWDSPAGSTVKYYFNFSNPKLRVWWVTEFVGQAVNESLFDGVYFDCSCGSPPGVAPADAQRFQEDAQLAFDSALALIKSAGKWASAWNSNGALSQAGCADSVRAWMKIGANASLSLQVLAPAFRGRGGGDEARGGGGGAALACGGCNVTQGVDAVSDGIIVPPIAMSSEADCCAACRNNSRCEAFVMGPCTSPNNCKEGEPYCFLVSGVRGFRPASNRRSGCVRGVAPNQPDMGKNNTVAAFLIARGPSAMLELPVAGAYESMASYSWSPLLDADFGEPLGDGAEGPQGVFTRRWSKANVTLDCNAYTSEFSFE